MATAVEKKRAGHFILSEGSGLYSRDTKTVASGNTLKAGQVCALNSSGKVIPIAATGNEAHTYTPNAAPTSGNFRLTLRHKDGNWVTTGDIAYNATNTQIATAINAVLGTSAVSVSGTMATTVVITFSGTGYASLSQPLGTCDISRLVGTASCPASRSTSAGATQNEVQTVTFGAAATGGTFKIGVFLPGDRELVFTDAITWSATDATFLSNINAALDQICGSGGIVATARAAVDTDLGFVLTFSGTGYAGLEHPLVVIDAAALTSVTTVDVAKTTAGGLAGGETGNVASLIAFDEVDASSADTDAVFIVRQAVVDRLGLYFGGGDPVTCIASLKNVGILVRDGGSALISRNDGA